MGYVLSELDPLLEHKLVFRDIYQGFFPPEACLNEYIADAEILI